MPGYRHTKKAAAYVALGGLFVAASAHSGDDLAPHDWLDRMSVAVRTTDYVGTVVRMHGDESEALKIVHTISDGVVREKVVVQEGNGLEIIRNGNEVNCILPDRKLVLVEEWDDQSTVFARLPASDIRSSSAYDVAVVGFERIAGRKAVALAIRPHDDRRYGHRLWLDVQTGFPLQTQLLDVDGEPLEQVKFADIRINSEILASEFSPSYSTDTWQWYTEPRRKVKQEVDTDWFAADVPAGFGIVSTHQELLAGASEPITHILYSDGLASVSVFIAQAKSADAAKGSSVGISSTYSTIVGDYRVTAVGEVPAATVEQIARSMQRSD